jgi:hypothetical protein
LALNAGWGPAYEWTYTLPLDDTDRQGLGDLIAVARRNGYGSWGELADVVEHAEYFRGFLRYQREARWAVGMSVLELIISDPQTAAAARVHAGVSPG